MGFQFSLFLLFLQLVIVMVWITSGVYSIPKFIFVRTITNDLESGQTETICIVHRKAFNAELFDLINFALLYILPLLVMTVSITFTWNWLHYCMTKHFQEDKHLFVSKKTCVIIPIHWPLKSILTIFLSFFLLIWNTSLSQSYSLFFFYKKTSFID